MGGVFTLALAALEVQHIFAGSINHGDTRSTRRPMEPRRRTAPAAPHKGFDGAGERQPQTGRRAAVEALTTKRHAGASTRAAAADQPIAMPRETNRRGLSVRLVSRALAVRLRPAVGRPSTALGAL